MNVSGQGKQILGFAHGDRLFSHCGSRLFQVQFFRHRHQKNVVFAGLCHGDQRFEYLFRILSQCRRQFYAGVLSGCLFPAAVYIGDFRLVQHADRIGFDDFFFCHNRYSPLSVTMV